MPSTRPIEDMVEAPRRRGIDEIKEEVSTELVEISGKDFVKFELPAGKYRAVELSDTSIGKGVVNNVSSFSATVLRCQLTSLEATGLSLPQTNFKDVVFKNCRLTLANLRSCDFTRCVFIDCNLDEADLGMSKLHHVLFSGCQLTGTDFSNANCDNVEFVSSSLATIKGVPGLKGASVSELNLVELSPLLAAEFGIKVS